MENATFTIAELTGVSAWDALVSIWWFPTLMLIGALLYTSPLWQHVYIGSQLQRRVQRIRWKIAAFICPEMEHMADESVDLKYGYISLENRIDGMRMDAEQDYYWSIN